MMLEADTPSLREQYPNGCQIYDARGRLLRLVVACNPETGEVICWKSSRIAATLLRIIKGSDWPYGDSLFRHHGFWPAPLRVVPRGGPAPAGVPYRVGDGAREQRVDMLNRIAGRVAAATGRAPARKLTVADLDELVDKVEGDHGAREQRAAIDAIEESIRPMLKRGEWLDAWRGIDR